MAVDRVVDPHLICYIRADSVVSGTETPPRVSSLQELRMEHDLGSYTVAKLEKLFKKLEETLQEWVATNPPQS